MTLCGPDILGGSRGLLLLLWPLGVVIGGGGLGFGRLGLVVTGARGAGYAVEWWGYSPTAPAGSGAWRGA